MADLKTRIHVMRHGQTEWNLDGRAQGHTDIPLDAVGQAQAKLAPNAFGDFQIDRIFSSDLSRAKDTADSVGRHLKLSVEIRQDLRERSFGDFEGRLFEEFRAKMRQDPVRFRPPGGESLLDVWDRMKMVSEDLVKLTGETLVVTHGGSGSILVARLIRANPDAGRALRFGNTGVTTLERREDGSYIIIRYNDQSHLFSEL